MQYRRLGRTGIDVAALCLGAMQFGWTSDEATSVTIMDAYVEAGGNFLDTADYYSRWIDGHRGGESEEVIGRWMQARGNRHDIVVATKVRHPMSDDPNDGGLSRRHILAAVEASLRRLRTDYIDLYQAHADDPSCPLDETIDAFDTLVRQGKARYVGASNYSAWRLTRALWVADRQDCAAYCSLQPHYNLALRDEFERELEPLCTEMGLGVIPYSPLAGGFLTGKYRPGAALPESARAAEIRRRYLDDRGFAILGALDSAAHDHGATPAQVALTWLLARPSVTAPIVGANSVAHLRETLLSADLHLAPAVIAALDVASEWRADVS